MVNLQFKLSDNFLDRYHRLFYNAEQEARTQLYFEALEFIKNNILGYGLNSSFSLIGYYPHNIFLEIMLSCGIIGFIIFLIILAIYFYKFKLAILDRFYSLPLCMMSLYIFLLWNISYDLSRSYVPLGIIAVVIGSSNSQNK
jgi:O-antigen ligase